MHMTLPLPAGRLYVTRPTKCAWTRLRLKCVVNVVEAEVQKGCICADQAVKNIKMAPVICVIATLRRGRQVLIPSGNTVIKAGDILVAVAGQEGTGSSKKSVQYPTVKPW